MTPTRELYWNIPGHIILYALLALSIIIFLNNFYERYRLWRLGKPEKRWDNMGERIKSALWTIFGHNRLLKSPYPGLMHVLIFGGFVVLFIGTDLVALQADLSIPLLYGRFYLGFSLFMDIFGMVVLVGLALATIRRYIQKPDLLDNKPEDSWSLILIAAIIVSGYIIEGIRISVTKPSWEVWSPIGYWLAGIFTSLQLDKGSQETAHRVLWWFHLLLTLGFIAYLPKFKLFHIISSSLNILFRPLKSKGAIESINLEEAETFGASKIQDLTWKQLLDLDACTRCGRCQDNCPAYLSEKPLSPKKMTQDLKALMVDEGKAILTSLKKEGKEEEERTPVRSLIGESVTEDEIWSCTTCRACQEECPVFVEHIPKTIELRRNLVLMESNFPAEAQVAFKNMETNGNPWGIGWAARADWAEGAGIKILGESEEAKADVLFWVGCAGSFDDRNKKITQALVKTFKAAGVDFAILGTEEKCCGDSARRLGNEYLYQMLVEGNIETLKGYNVTKIVTACPHCFNTLKNEYPQFDGNFEVIHHSQFLAQLLKDGKLPTTRPLDKSITYHDSCYLGRYNDIYFSPREVINSIPGLKLQELEKSRERSFCCGAGGGRMWLEEHLGKRINELRTDQIIEKKTDLVATACPFCLTMIEDGLKVKELSEAVKAYDIAELISQSLEA
ncbi:MAG: 4Fe-4S dicluster domain-containing protein [Candidatus Tectomicrobia bacterium]|uniref:4Fe-4S dicluster domain-containing protein n=1 Tax=Tectimicrobiota bacterium TaxID=2528274 RepID=A0A933GL67_UNCTE|nr:4Fe-4S dicluster domain-containing protein [Candidatus Tectomicrobia bacterium]